MSDFLKRIGVDPGQGSETSIDAAKVAGEMRNAEEAAQQLESDPNYPYKSENLSFLDRLSKTNSLASDPVDDMIAFKRNLQPERPEGAENVTLNEDVMNSVHNSGVRNWWNSFMNSIDEIDKLRYSGEMLKFQKQIDELEQQKADILKSGAMNEDVQDQLAAIELQLASIRSNSEYHSTYNDMKRQMKDIETSPISKDYAAKQQAIAEQEYSNFFDYLAYDAPIDMGGSASEMGTQILSAVGISVARNLLLGAASGSAGGPVGAVVGGVIGVAATLGSTYATYKMREHESSAEMYGAFEEKVGKKVNDFIQRYGREPNEDEQRQIRLDAYKGLDSVYKQNMNLMAGDALDILLMAAPWAKSLNALKVGARMGRFSLAGTRLGQATAATLSEALEEADQYGITQQYIAGTLKDNQSWTENLMDNIETRVKNMRYLAGDVNEEWQMDAEFRNSMRAGGILGGIMGGGSNVIAAGNSIFNPPVTTKDIKGNIQQWLEPSETVMKANMYSKFFERGDEVYMFDALRGLKDQKIEGVTPQDIDAAIETAERAYKTWQSIKPSGGVAASLTTKQKGVVFREKWAVEENLRKAKTSANDHNINVVNPLLTQIRAEVEGPAADATIVQNKINALRHLKDEIELNFPDIKEAPTNLQEQYEYITRQLKATEKVLDEAYEANPELSEEQLGSTLDSNYVIAEQVRINNNRKVIDLEKRSKDLNKQLSTLEGVREFFKNQTSMAETAAERAANRKTPEEQEADDYDTVKKARDGAKNRKSKSPQEGGQTEMDIAMAMAGEAWGGREGTTKTEKEAASTTQTPEQAEAQNSKSGDALGTFTDVPPGAEQEGGRPGWGETNTFTTKAAYEAALQSLKGKAFAGIPPEAFTIVAYHLEAGARQIAEVARLVINDFKRLDMDTPENRNAIKKAYAGTLVDPVLAEEFAPMSSFEEVKAFDIQNFDDENTSGEREIGPGLTAEQTTALGKAKAALDRLLEKMNDNLAEMTNIEIYDMLWGINFIQEKYNEYHPTKGFDPDEFGMDEDFVLSFPDIVSGALFEQMEENAGLGSKEFDAMRNMFGKFVDLLSEGVFSDEDIKNYSTQFAADWADAHSRRGRQYIQQQRYLGKENNGGFARTTLKQTEGELARNIEGIGEIVWDENAGTSEEPSYRQLFMPLRDANGDRVVAKAIPGFSGDSTFNAIYTTNQNKARNGSPTYFIYVPRTKQIGGRTVATEVNYNGEYRHDAAIVVGPDGIPRVRNLDKAEASERFKKVPVYELPAALNAVPVTEIYETQNMDGVKILTINTPAIMEGEEVVIIHEPDWEYYKTDPNDHNNKVLNVYRASQVVNGQKVEGAKPLSVIPAMDRINIEDTETAAIRERFAEDTTPLYLRVGKKSNGVANFKYEEEQGVRHPISNAKNAWVKNADGSVTPTSEVLDEPIFALGWSTDEAGGLRIDNYDQLSDKQRALVEHGDNETANRSKIPKTLQGETTEGAHYESGRVYVFQQQPDGSWRPTPTNRRRLNQTELDKITSGSFIADQFQGYSQKLHKNRLGKLSHLVPTSLVGHIDRSESSTDPNSPDFVSDGLKMDKWRGYALNFTAKGILIDMGDGYIYEIQVTSNKKTGEVYDNISRLFDETFQPDADNWFTVKKINARTGKYEYRKKNGKANYFYYIKNVQEIRKLRAAFMNQLNNMYMAVDAKLINSKQKFADPIEDNVTHDTYYQYLQAREVLSLQTPAFEPSTGAQIFLDYSPEADPSVLSEDSSDEQAKQNQAEQRTDNLEEPPVEKAPEIEKEPPADEKLDSGLSDEDDFEIPFATREYKKPAPGYAIMSQEELQFLQDTVGEGAISIARGIDHVIAGGKEAWGFFSNAVTYLAERAEEGTAYHEAWHHVFRMALTPKQRAEVLQSAREKDSRYANIKDDYELEELMAEDFRNYMLYNRPPKSGIIRRVFQYLKRMINAIAGRTTTFDNFFRDVAEGNFFQSELKEENLRLLSPLKQPRLIELTTKSGKPISNNHTIQRKLIGHAKWVFQNILTNKVGGIHASKRSIDAIVTDSKMVDKLIADTRNELIKEVNELSAKENLTGIERWKILALTEMVADENWNDSGNINAPLEGFATLIKTSLRNNGYTVRIKYQAEPTRESAKIGETSPSIEDMEQVADDETEDNKDTSIQHIHDLPTYLKSKKDTMSSGLRQGMSMIPPYKIANGKVVIDVVTKKPVLITNEAGWVDPIDFEDLYSKVARHMVDVPHELMQSKMATLATLDDDFARLQHYLDERKSKADGFFAAFYSFFANTQYGFIVVDNSKGKAKVIIANATSVGNVLSDKWRDSANIYETYNDENDDPIVIKEKGTKLKEDLNAISAAMLKDSKKSKKSGTKENKQRYVNMVKPILKELGISISDQAWETAIVSNSNGKSVLTKLLFGTSNNSPSLALLLDAVEKGVDIYQHENSSIKRFVNLQADFEMDYYTGTFMNGKNQSVYSINLEAYNTMKMARFRDPLTAREELAKYDEDEYYTDPNADNYAKYRNLILDNVRKYINASERDSVDAAQSMEIFEMDSYKPDWGDAKEYTETSTVDAYTIRYIMYAGMAGSNTFFANTGTKSDKGRSQWMRVMKLERPAIAAALRKVFDGEAARIRRMKAVQDEANRLDAVATDETITQAERDQAAKDLKELKTNMEIDGYWDANKPANSQALNFQTFKDLGLVPDVHSQDLSTEGISEIDKARINTEIDIAVELLMDRVVDANLQEMRRLGILDLNEAGEYVTTDLGGGSGFGTSGISANMSDLEGFILNDFIWATEYARLINGDQAFYENLNVYFKRGYQGITPGNQPFIDTSYEVAQATRRTHMSLALINDVYKENGAEAVYVWAAPYDKTLTPQIVERAIAKFKESPKKTVKQLFPNVSSDREKALNVIKGYYRVNKTDGQAWCSINFYRDLMKGMNRWSEQQEEYWLNAWSKHITVEDALSRNTWTKANGTTVVRLDDKMRNNIRKGIFANAPQPLKPFYYGEREHTLGKGENQQKMLLFEQFKCSIKPVTPELADAFSREGLEEGFTTFSDLYDRINGVNKYKGNPIDVVAHDSGMKVGVYGVVSPNEMSDAVVRSMPLANLRFPQNIDSKTKEEANLGSQMAKLIVSNMIMDSKYLFQASERTGQWMYDSYHGAWGELIRRSTNKLKKELGLNAEDVNDWSLPDDYESRIKFFRNLANLLRETNLERDLPEMYDEILRITRLSAATDAQVQPYAASLDFPPIARRYEAILMALFRNRVLRQKFPGSSMVQVADYGSKTSDELKFIQKNGDRYVAAEVAIPYKMAVKIFGEDIGYGDINKVLDDVLQKDNKTGKERRAEIMKALKILGYRIPTQGKNSMLPMKITKILSPAEGMSIVVPGEITTQMGSDFDIDKMYLMFPSVEKNEETGRWVKSDYRSLLGEKAPALGDMNDAQLKNFLLDMSYSILLDPKHITETLAPLDVGLMGEKIDQYKNDRTDTSHRYGSMHTNIYYESINKYAKIAVGATANAITGQSFFPVIKPGIFYTVNEKTGKKKYSFHIRLKQNGRAHDYMFDKITTFDGELISDTLKMLNNAALDNAKDPKLGRLNLNNTTLGTAMLLAVSGFDAKYILDFINQPIIRGFAEFVENSNVPSIVRNRNEFIKSLGEEVVALNKDRPAKPSEIDISQLGDLASSDLGSLTDEQMIKQLEMLNEFISYHKPARELSKMFRQLSPETAKEMSSFASLELYEYEINDFGGGYFRFEQDPFATGSAQRTSEFYYRGWVGARQFASLLYPYFTNAYRGLKRQIAELQRMKNTDFTKKQLDRINGLVGLHRVGRNIDFARKVFDPEKWRPLLFDKDKSLASKILKVQARLRKAGTLQNNYLLRELQIAPFYIQRNAWTQLITFNNTAKRSRAQKNRISQTWRDMLNSSDPEIKEIAELLPIYNILVNGFQAGPRDMTEMVPLSFWEQSDIINQYMNSMSPALLEEGDIFYNGSEVLEDILLNGASELIPQLRGFYTQSRGLTTQEKTKMLEEDKNLTIEDVNKIKVDQVVIGKKNGEKNVLVAGQHYIMDPETKAIKRLTVTANAVPGILMTNDQAPVYIKISHDKRYWDPLKGWVVNKKKSRDRFYKQIGDPVEIEEGVFEYQYEEIPGRGEDYMFYHMNSWGIGESYYPKFDDKQLFAKPKDEMDVAAGLMTAEGDAGMPGSIPSDIEAMFFGKEKKGDKVVKDSDADNTPSSPPIDDSLMRGLFDKKGKKSDENDPLANISEETPEELRLKEETKTKLLASLSAMGVNADVVDDMQERYGIDAYGVANFANMSVDLAKGNRGWNSLPEEVAHFYVRGLKGRPAFEELLNAAKGTKEYEEVVREYGALYGYDERRMLEEAAGKIIANRIFKQEEMGTLARILNRIKRVILNIFGKANPLETAALNILRGDVEEFGGGEGVMFKKGMSFNDMLNSLHGDVSTSEHAAEAGKRFVDPKDDVDVGIATSNVDIEMLKQAFANTELNEATKARMNRLIKKMQKDIKKKYQYARAVKGNDAKYVQRMKELVNALDTLDMAEFIEMLAAQANADMAYVSKRASILSTQVGGNIEGRIVEINRLLDTMRIYDPMSEFTAVLSNIIEGQSTLGMEPLEKIMENALGAHAKLKEKLMDIEHQNVTQLVRERADPSITKEEIIRSVYNPKGDINWFNKTLFGLADSTDMLLSFIGAEMLRAVKRARIAFNNYLNGIDGQAGLRTLDANLRKWSTKSNPYEDLIELNAKTDKYEFAKPGSSKYDAIMALSEDHPLRAYYEGAVIPYVEARAKIPRFLRGGSEFNIPVVKATGFETKRVRTYVEEAVDNFRITGEEEEHYDPTLAYVRYRFNSNLPSKYVSMEITTSLSEAMKDIYHANERRKIEPLFKSVVNMAKFRQYSDKTLFSKSEEAGEQSRANEKIKNIAKAFLYEGSYEAVTADIPEPIKKALKKVGVSMEDNEQLNMTKFAFAMKGVMTMINLGLNIPGQIVNVITQFVYIIMEGLGGRNYTIGDLTKGLFKIATAGPKMAFDYNAKRPSSKESLMLERIGIFEDTGHHDNKVLYNKRGNLFNGFLKRLAYLGFKLGNSISQPTIAFAMMSKMKFKTSKGEISYYDAWEHSNNSLRLNAEVAEQLKEKYGSVEEGIFRIEEPIRRESLRISDIHEVYDRGTAQNSIIGSFVMMHRSWLGPLALNLFGTYRRDPITGKREQGFINTLFTSAWHGMMKKDIKFMKMLIPWMNNLSEKDINPFTGKAFTKDEIALHKANLKKAYAMAAFTLMTALMVDDEDEEELIKSDPFKLYVFLRVRSEVLALLNPKDIYRIAQSPTAAIGLIEKFTDIAGYYTWDFEKGGEELESGFFEGYSRREKAISQVIPVYNQYLSSQHLEDRIKFLSK